MADEPKLPEARDDDVEEVSDKLSIAAAMWAKGDRADALNWVRRAAESASDAEQDMRALELAKAASELSAYVDQSGTHAAAQPAESPSQTLQAAGETPSQTMKAGPSAAPPRKPPTAPPPKPSSLPGKAPAAASSVPRKPAPAARPPGGKLPPLPPLRPLGSAPAAPKSPRMSSMVSSATGSSSASGTITRDEPPGKPMPWDEPAPGERSDDDEPTNQIVVPEDPADMDSTATREIAVMAQQVPREEQAARDEPTSERQPSAEAEQDSAPQSAPATRRVAELELAVGVRVRLVQSDHGVHVYPEGETNEGVAAIVVPLHADDDLRSIFQK